MVETVHQGPHKGFKMDIIFDNWARRSRVVKNLNCEVVIAKNHNFTTHFFRSYNSEEQSTRI